jgi:hypothetical protein
MSSRLPRWLSHLLFWWTAFCLIGSCVLFAAIVWQVTT